MGSKRSNPARISEIVCGRRSVYEVLRRSAERVSSIYIRPNSRLDEELQFAVSKFKPVVEASDEQLFELCNGAEHQGIALKLKGIKNFEIEELLGLGGTTGIEFLILDQINDPQNLGALFRIADATGVKGVILSKDSSSGITPVVHKASVGASTFVPFSIVNNLTRAIEKLKKNGYWIIGTSGGPESKSVYDTDVPLPGALVMGSEGKGMRRLTQDSCDLTVSLPMCGIVESVNVSQAASAVLYEFVRRTRNSG